MGLVSENTENSIGLLPKNIDYFKLLALQQLTKKPRYTYQISVTDLLCLNNCPLCGCEDLKTISEVYLASGLKFFVTKTCRRCVFTFRTISPSIGWFEKCWHQIATDKLEVFNRKAEYYKAKRYRVYAKMLRPYLKNRSRLLDIGASYGTGSMILKNEGFLVDAVEIEENKANYLHKKLKIRVVDKTIEHFLAHKHNYNMVVFSNCLEHLDKPAEVMLNMRNIIRPNGLLLLSIPNIWTCLTWSDALYLTHKSNFTLQNILELVTRSGFEVLEMRTVPSFFPNDTTNELAFILRATNAPASLQFAHPGRQARLKLLQSIQSLYKNGLPIKPTSKSSQPLRFIVPYIDQFFQTINLDDKKISRIRIKQVEFLTFTSLHD